jgi:drug/metabolite transporter (DMT)-like permease
MRFPRAAQNVVFVLLTGLGWGLLGPASKVLYAAEPGVFDGVTVSVARAAWALPIFLFALALAWGGEGARGEAQK